MDFPSMVAVAHDSCACYGHWGHQTDRYLVLSDSAPEEIAGHDQQSNRIYEIRDNHTDLKDTNQTP